MKQLASECHQSYSRIISTKSPVILHNNLEREYHKRYGPPTSVHDCSWYVSRWIWYLHRSDSRNTLVYTHTTSRTLTTCHIGLGSVTLPAQEAGDFVKLILLYCNFTSRSLLKSIPAGYSTALLPPPFFIRYDNHPVWQLMPYTEREVFHIRNLSVFKITKCSWYRMEHKYGAQVEHHFLNHNTHVNWPEIETGPLEWKAWPHRRGLMTSESLCSVTAVLPITNYAWLPLNRIKLDPVVGGSIKILVNSKSQLLLNAHKHAR